jgi:hypothetical protein
MILYIFLYITIFRKKKNEVVKIKQVLKKKKKIKRYYNY